MMQKLDNLNLRGVTAAAKRPPPPRWTAQATRSTGEVIDLLARRRKAPAATRSTSSADTTVVLADGTRADWRTLPEGTHHLAGGGRRLVVGEQAVAADMRRMRARRAGRQDRRLL